MTPFKPPWKSMESAPRDGTSVLLGGWCDAWYVAYWDQKRNQWRTDAGWIAEPMAWTPLPPAPEEE